MENGIKYFIDVSGYGYCDIEMLCLKDGLLYILPINMGRNLDSEECFVIPLIYLQKCWREHQEEFDTCVNNPNNWTLHDVHSLIIEPFPWDYGIVMPIKESVEYIGEIR